MKKSVAGAVLLAGLFGTVAASAVTYPVNLLTFDDIAKFDPVTGNNFIVPIPQGYGGLNWYNLVAIAAPYASPVGFQNGFVSSDYVATNPDMITPCPLLLNAPACSAFGSAHKFTLRDAYFAGAARDGLKIDVLGVRNNSIVYGTQLSVDTLGPTYAPFNWSSIDTVIVIAFGGTLDPAVAPAQDSTLFALDNLRYQLVPEPGAVALVGLGLGALALRRRRRAV